MWTRALTALVLLPLACGEQRAVEPPATAASVTAGGADGGAEGFDAERAFADLRDQVAIGPRPAGSEAAGSVRELIATRLRQAGFPVERHPFVVATPARGPIEMSNLVGVRRGRTDALILIAAHYDTKDVAGVRFEGANDGASGVAVLLELARALGPEPGEAELRLVFLDGEEAFGPSITGRDGLYGSRELAARLAAEGELDRIHAFLLVDMVGDRDLRLATDRNSSPRLRAMAREIAREQGAPELFDPAQTLSLVDDHLPLREHGVREVLALIDFAYGGPSMPGTLWHTADDALPAVSAESLNTVGRLVVALVGRLDGEIGARRARETGKPPQDRNVRGERRPEAASRAESPAQR